MDIPCATMQDPRARQVPQEGHWSAPQGADGGAQGIGGGAQGTGGGAQGSGEGAQGTGEAPQGTGGGAQGTGKGRTGHGGGVHRAQGAPQSSDAPGPMAPVWELAPAMQ